MSRRQPVLPAKPRSKVSQPATSRGTEPTALPSLPLPSQLHQSVTARQPVTVAPPSVRETALPDIKAHRKQQSLQLDGPVDLPSALPARAFAGPVSLGAAAVVASAVTKLKKATAKGPKIYILLSGEDRSNHTKDFIDQKIKSSPGHPFNVRDTKANTEYTVTYSGHGDPVWAEIPQLHEERVKTALGVLIERSMDPSTSNLSDEYPLNEIRQDVIEHIRTAEHRAAAEKLAAHLNRSEIILFTLEEVEFFFDVVKLNMALTMLSVFSDAFVVKEDLWQKLICFHLGDELSTVQDEWMPTVSQLLETVKRFRTDAEKERLLDEILNNFCDSTNMFFVWTIDQQLKRSRIALCDADQQFLMTSMGLGLLENIVGKLYSASSLDAESWLFIKEELRSTDYFSLSMTLDALPSPVEGQRVPKIDIRVEHQKMRDQKTPAGESTPLKRERSGVFAIPSRRSFLARAVGLGGGSGSRSGSPKGELLARIPSIQSVQSGADSPPNNPASPVTRNGRLAVDQGIFGTRSPTRRGQVRLVDSDAQPDPQEQVRQFSYSSLGSDL